MPAVPTPAGPPDPAPGPPPGRAPDRDDAGAAPAPTEGALTHDGLLALEHARLAAADGDPGEVVRRLRGLPDAALVHQPHVLAETAGLVASAAAAAGFSDLAASASAVREAPDDPHLLYRYAFDATERGAAFLAVPPLTVALAQDPDSAAVRMELAAALQAEDRYADAVRILLHATTMERWLGRWLLVLNCLLAGDLEGARQWFTRLGRPQEPGQERLAYACTRMLARAQLLTGSTRLDVGHAPGSPDGVLGTGDLRGWHYVLNGGVLTTTSAHGTSAEQGGMNGRYAFVQDSYAGCRRGLDRLALALATGSRRPTAVGLLGERPSRALGLAAARLLDLPARDLAGTDPAHPDRGGTDPTVPGRGAPLTLVTVYAIADLDAAVVDVLRSTPGLLLAEHATCWTAPPPVAADVSTLLHQVVVAPWDPQLRVGSDGATGRSVADDRPAAELADQILAAGYDAQESAHDPDEALAAFVARLGAQWATGAVPRERVWPAGPVTSSRFR